MSFKVIHVITSILNTLRWSLSIGRKFFSVAPITTLSITVVTLISQFSLLFAFFLPLKILIILGSPSMPRYFPDSFKLFDRDTLVIALSVMAVGAYVLHVLADKVIDWLARTGSYTLFSRTRKMVLFENQEDVARQGYRRYSNSLAGSVFIFLAMGVLGYLYPALLLLLLVYGIVILLLLSVLPLFYPLLSERLMDNSVGLVSTLSAVGFLLSFAFMVYLFLQQAPPSILLAIVTLLLIRRALAKLSDVVSDLRSLYKQRIRINALFFHSHSLLAPPNQKDDRFWSLVGHPVREQWIQDMISEAIDDRPVKIELMWYSMGVSNIIAFKIKALYGDGRKTGYYLIKLFNIKRSLFARQEVSLLTAMPKLPALSLLAVDEVDGFLCHLFEWFPGQTPSPQQFNSSAWQWQALLMRYKPSQALVSSYLRSHSMLWQRLNTHLFTRLEAVAQTSEDRRGLVDIVHRYYTQLDKICARLQALPMSICNPNTSRTMLLAGDNDECIFLHWGGWTLEPLGSGWSLKPKVLVQLGEVCQRLANKRSDMEGVNEKDVRLAALMYGFECLCQRQKYSQALELLPMILACM